MCYGQIAPLDNSNMVYHLNVFFLYFLKHYFMLTIVEVQSVLTMQNRLGLILKATGDTREENTSRLKETNEIQTE